MYRDRGVSAGLSRTSAAVRAGQIVATAGTVTLGVAMAGAAAHAVALGQSAIVAGGAIGLLPSAIAGAVATAIAAKVAFGGLAEAWKQTGAAATAGGGGAVDVARRVEMAHRHIRDATVNLADAQREAAAAQDALTRAREDASERLEELSRTLRGARLDERGAMLAVEEARRRLAQARGGGDSLEIRRAQLAYEESVHTLETVRDRVSDLAKEQEAASANGVEGSDEVQTAIQRQEQAQRGLTAATERLADAQRELAEAGKGVGGAANKAQQALDALAPSARELVLTLHSMAPAWAAAGKGAQQATFAGVAGDMQNLGMIYLPRVTGWLRRMGEGFNIAIRSTLGLAQTNEFASDVGTTLEFIDQTVRRLAQSVAPFVNGFMQFVAVGATFLPGLAGDVGSIADRFERWAIAARESGQMQQWITTGVTTLKQFWEIAKNLVMSVVAIFKAGENTATLDGLVSATAAMRAWLESTEGQQKVNDVLTFLRNLLSDIGAIVPVVMGQADSLSAGFKLFGGIVEFLASHLDTVVALLPALAAFILAAQVAQVAANVAMAASIPLRVLELTQTWGMRAALQAHTSALVANTAVKGGSTVATAANTVATTASDVATKRSIVSMVAARAAMLAGAAATAIVTAAQWLWNAAMYANPVGLIILAVIALIAGIVLLWKNSETFRTIVTGAFNAVWGAIKFVWDWIKNNWQLLLAILTGPIGLAVLFITKNWDAIKAGATGVWQWITDKFNALVGFVTSLPGRMRTAAANLWDGLKDSFRAALNWLIGKWNNFSLTLGGGNVLGMNIPSVTLNTPNLPFLDVGGDITRTGLAVVHEGERVVPAAEVSPLPKEHGGGGGRRDILVLKSDGSFWSDAIMQTLRKAVRDRGGNFDTLIELSAS